MAGDNQRRSTGPTSAAKPAPKPAAKSAPKARRQQLAPVAPKMRVARQERSLARINELLDAAARVYDAVGIEAATMTEVAASASTSIGTLYHWFPDKESLTKALSERLLEDFLDTLGPILVDRPEESTAALVARVMAAMATFAGKHPAFVVLLAAEAASGSRLHESLAELTRALIEMRVPGVDADERDVTADTLVSIGRQMLNAFDRWPKRDRAAILEEYRFVLTAYLAAKYPLETQPAWTQPPVGLTPSRTGRPVQPANAPTA